MKTKITILILSACVLIMSAKCNKRVGSCEHPIQASLSSSLFPAEGGIVTVTTSHSDWWIQSIEIDDEYFTPDNDNLLFLDDATIPAKPFTIQRKGSELYVSVSANTSNTERKLGIVLQAGDCFDGFDITQAGKGNAEN